MTAPARLQAASAIDAQRPARQALRQRLLADREQFAASPAAQGAGAALAAHLARLVRELEPEQLGVYWPIRGEFNAVRALAAVDGAKLALALPFVQRRPPRMHYRAWDGQALSGVDECGLPAPEAGAEVVPDVVLAPCLGYTRSGFRLGYGGGYFDRWIAEHPQATAIGVAWSIGEIADEDLAPEAHDRPLMLVLTERGVIG
jgi:5,10-methenyltetrahydrofolate synthetase